MLKVCKFGGTSLADAKQFQKVKSIVQADASRRVVVVSAPGRRHPSDQKITDLLYLLHAHLIAGQPCFSVYQQIRHRYLEIEKALGICCNMDTLTMSIYGNLNRQTSLPYLVSRGEYLAAKLMAEYLGFTFIDSARWLFFDKNGNVDIKRSAQRLRALAKDEKIVTPGFYGISESGEISLFSRGGSDITGALAANFLDADEYENWTDVNGLLCADPRIVPEAKTVPYIRYEDFIQLSKADLQVLHSSAIVPVTEKNIPLSIRNTNDPEGTFTLIENKAYAANAAPLVLAQKKLGEDVCLLIMLVHEADVKEAILNEIQAMHPLLIIEKNACVYAFIASKQQVQACRTLYRCAYEKGSLD